MNNLEKFGKLITEDLRDSALNRYLDLESGHCGSPVAMSLSEKLSKFTEEQKSIIRQVLTNALDTGIHDFLFALQESEEIKVLSNGENVVELSDGLNGEIFTEDGWFEKLSQHKESGI